MARGRIDRTHGAGRGAISVFTSSDLQVVIGSLRSMDRELRSQLNRATKELTTPEWQEEVRGRVSTRLESRVLSDTARVRVSARNLTLVSGASSKRLSGGATVRDLVKATEFGSDQVSKVTYKARSKNGVAYTVTRRSNRQFRPRNAPQGYVVYSAASAFIPRAASLWVQTTVRTTHEAFEKGS